MYMQEDDAGGDKRDVRLSGVYVLVNAAGGNGEKQPITAREFMNEQTN